MCVRKVKHLKEWQVLLLCQNLIGELDLQQREAVTCIKIIQGVGLIFNQTMHDICNFMLLKNLLLAAPYIASSKNIFVFLIIS